jgi:CRISPR type III-A-associated RAMP protein Csm5
MAQPIVSGPLHIEIVSPVHIGDGDRISKKSFVSPPHEDKAHVISEDKLLAVASQTPQAAANFEKFCLDNNYPLQEFLSTSKINPADISAYSLSKLGENLKTGREILSFIKTGLPPQPYIPGASIKGALRSVFLRGMLQEDSGAKETAIQKIQEMFDVGKDKQADNALENWFFCNDNKDAQHYDWSRLLQIGDTRLGKLSQLRLAQVEIFSTVFGNQLQSKGFKLSPEVFTPETRLTAQFAINQYLTTKVANKELNFKNEFNRVISFPRICNLVAKKQIEQEIAFFKKHNQHQLVEWYEKLEARQKQLEKKEFECLLRLGWGAGYDDKTVSDLLDEDEDETVFDQIRNIYSLPVGKPHNGKRLPKLDSPKSRKLVVIEQNGNLELLPLGWIILRA